MVNTRIDDAFWSAVEDLAPEYDAMVDAGTLSQDQARRLHTHAVWTRIVPKLGLRYDRVEPAEAERS